MKYGTKEGRFSRRSEGKAPDGTYLARRKTKDDPLGLNSVSFT